MLKLQGGYDCGREGEGSTREEGRERSLEGGVVCMGCMWVQAYDWKYLCGGAAPCRGKCRLVPIHPRAAVW